ncbi:MAG: cache domain-containing protein [Planctomycetes bacterium]|uniref:cache domain-containing protein n=1 Tax=Candidatus Wunengus sp. YC65 TaxID=3367701 RepID=UPI001E07630F|nr:cache domain-containing protein [Planctomycetota bacterium]
MIKMFKERIVFVIATFVFFGLFPLILFKMLAFPKASAELKQGVQRNLEGIVNKQKEILTLLWDERKSHARSISDTIQSALFIQSNDDFVSLINGRDGHEYLRLKSQLECTKTDYGYKGIFICDGAGIVQMATGDGKSLVGMNIMKEKLSHNIQETLYDGKTYISEVVNFSLTGDSLKENGTSLPSMFLSYPIKGQNHDVIGAVVLWMDTSILNKAMKSVALGKTGEAYLVNKDGVMLTESKFSKYVKNANGKDSVSYKVVEPDTQTITKGVEKCISGKISGYDLDGYRDYDGLKVVGAWTWLKDLNMGLIVEIDADEASGVVDNINSLIIPLMVVMIIPAFIFATLIYRKLSTGYVLKDMSLPKKATLGVTSIIMVGFVIAILDGYELRKERGYLREQKYKVHNPLNVLGSIVTQRDEDFIKSNISKFKEDLPIFKSENTIHTKGEEREIVKSSLRQPLEKTVATWELKP